MTKFISIEEKEELKIKTVFTHCLLSEEGWQLSNDNICDFEKIVYLGRCNVDGDMFAAYYGHTIAIYKGKKGTEFNN